jgi:putative FmdB family regulatory protein
MPLYDYRCSACHNVTEVRHGFGETYAEPCPSCGGKLARVFNPAPIVFKGSGFYVTDSRGKSSTASTGTSSKDTAAKEAPAEAKAAKPEKSTPAKDPAA